jgi:hypothetical protein
MLLLLLFVAEGRQTGSDRKNAGLAAIVSMP